MPDEPAPSANTPRLTKEQKTGFALLFVFALLSIGFGTLQIRNTMYAPFALNSAPPPDLKDQVTGVDALRFRDTDHDALTDFDELYVYATSPYLYDTFGYGISDKEVISRGLARCPKGQDCGNVVINEGALSKPNIASTTQALVSIDPPGTPPPDIKEILTDPAQIRALLLEGGMDPVALGKISDQVLMAAVQEIMQTTTPFGEVPNLSSLGIQPAPAAAGKITP